MVNIVLEDVRDTRYTEVSDEVFKKAESNNKNILLFVIRDNPNPVKRYSNIELSINLSIGKRYRRFLGLGE